MAAGCQKRRRRVKRHRENRFAVPRQSRHASCRRVAEEVAARESARAQPERVIVTNRAFAVEAKQPSSKHGAQSPSGNQQQPVLRANTTSHRVQCIGFKGAPVATRENGLQLLHGGLKRVQERGARYQVADELRIPAPSLSDRVLIHLCWQEEHSCMWRRKAPLKSTEVAPPPPLRQVLLVFARLLEPDFGAAGPVSTCMT